MPRRPASTRQPSSETIQTQRLPQRRMRRPRRRRSPTRTRLPHRLPRRGSALRDDSLARSQLALTSRLRKRCRPGRDAVAAARPRSTSPMRASGPVRLRVRRRPRQRPRQRPRPRRLPPRWRHRKYPLGRQGPAGRLLVRRWFRRRRAGQNSPRARFRSPRAPRSPREPPTTRDLRFPNEPPARDRMSHPSRPSYYRRPPHRRHLPGDRSRNLSGCPPARLHSVHDPSRPRSSVRRLD